jgi:hypothetical protein
VRPFNSTLSRLGLRVSSRFETTGDRMSIRKQEFYEGAALHILSRSGRIGSLTYRPPLFLLNGSISILLKYSTKGRSPWGFTLTPDEQKLLRSLASTDFIVGLICGSDGIAAFDANELGTIATFNGPAIHISCYRKHGEHYEVSGPSGVMLRKIPPSRWQRILDDRGIP